MPELPDLEVFADNLTKRLKGKVLEKMHMFKNAKTSAPAGEFRKAFEGQAVASIYREGKELRLAFNNDHILGIHLMLRGKLSWLEDGKTADHTLLELIFAGNVSLALSDFQHNARISLDPEQSLVPDAMSPAVDGKFIHSIMNSRASVKSILLDQHRIRGIGNAYADEILWDAGISPFSIANKIPAEQLNGLAKSITKVLKEAVKKVDKAAPGIIGGEVRDFLLIHNAAKKKSPAGAVINKKMTGGRPTYFTNEQKEYR